MTMDSCDAVDKEVLKFVSKCEEYKSVTSHRLQESIDQLNGIHHDLEHCDDNAKLTQVHLLLLTSSIHKLKDALEKVSSDHKELHPPVSKIGRAIDKNFNTEFGTALQRKDALQGENKDLLNTVVCEHFLRGGMLSTAEALMKDASIEMDEFEKEPFMELNSILESLQRKNLQPALTWAEENREKLQAQHSPLEFKLHRMRFIELLKLGPSVQSEILQYVKKFGHFAVTQHKDIQRLMGALLYLPHGLEDSPYSDLLDPVFWLDTCETFTKDACQLMGMSVNSPLSIAVETGYTALPPLLNMKTVMEHHQLSDVLNAKDELPVEIDLGPEHRFHSVFACPILRQQTTRLNPPVRLTCGHVISRDALHKLAIVNKIKCPYCPGEQSITETKEIHF